MKVFHLPPRVFGCVYYVQDHYHSPRIDKLAPRTLKCIFLRYSRTQKGYCCYCPRLQNYLISVYVTFSESVPFFSSSTPVMSASIPLPVPIDSPTGPTSTILPSVTVSHTESRSLQVYCHHQQGDSTTLA